MSAPARMLIATAAACLVLAVALHGSDLDRRLFLAINADAGHWAGAMMLSCITVLGHGLIATMLLAPALLRAPQVLMAALFATPAAMVLSWVPKGLIHAARPSAVLDPASVHIVGMRLAGHNSFPSGHTITAFLVVGVVLAAGPTRPRLALAIAIAAGGVAVAWSRIAVGAHWPADVIAGAGIGLLAGVAGTEVERRWRCAAQPWAPVLLALVVFGCAVALAFLDLGYPLSWPLRLALAPLGAAVAAVALWRVAARRSRVARLPG